VIVDTSNEIGGDGDIRVPGSPGAAHEGEDAFYAAS